MDTITRRRSALSTLSLVLLTIGAAQPSQAQIPNWLKNKIFPNGTPNSPQTRDVPSLPNTYGTMGNGYNTINMPPMIVGAGPNGMPYYIPQGVSPQMIKFPRKPDPDKAEDLFHQGDDLLNQGQPQQAMPILTQSYLYNPSSAPTLNDLGVASDRESRTNQAMAYYKLAVQADPQMASAYANAALDSDKLGDGRSCYQDLTQALRLDPNQPDWWYWRANEETRFGQTSNALYDYGRSIALNPKASNAYHWRGILELRMKRDALAHTDLQHAEKLDPSLTAVITQGVGQIMNLRLAQQRQLEAQQKQAKAEQRMAQQAKSSYLSHRREIASVVSRGPSYANNVYVEARRDGDSPEEAKRLEEEAHQKYDRDVALQNAWENSDYETMDKINAGEMDSSEIASYDSSSSPTAGGGETASDSGESPEMNSPEQSEPEPAPEPAPEAPSEGGE